MAVLHYYMEAVGLAIHAQLVHGNITKQQAEKLIATIEAACKARKTKHNSEAFENLALRGAEYRSASGGEQ